jgi:putative acetyltransferase
MGAQVPLLTIGQEDPRQPEILELFDHSDSYAASLYPAEGRYPVDTDYLAGPAVRFFVARNGAAAVGCGAIVIAPDGTAEIKRVVVHPEARGLGIGRRLMAAIEAAARHEGVSTLLLETGPRSQEALALYRRCGYRDRGPFGAYPESPHSVFMELTLELRGDVSQ